MCNSSGAHKWSGSRLVKGQNWTRAYNMHLPSDKRPSLIFNMTLLFDTNGSQVIVTIALIELSVNVSNRVCKMALGLVERQYKFGR